MNSLFCPTLCLVHSQFLPCTPCPCLLFGLFSCSSTFALLHAQHLWSQISPRQSIGSRLLQPHPSRHLHRAMAMKRGPKGSWCSRGLQTLATQVRPALPFHTPLPPTQALLGAAPTLPCKGDCSVHIAWPPGESPLPLHIFYVLCMDALWVPRMTQGVATKTSAPVAVFSHLHFAGAFCIHI